MAGIDIEHVELISYSGQAWLWKVERGAEVMLALIRAGCSGGPLFLAIRHSYDRYRVGT